MTQNPTPAVACPGHAIPPCLGEPMTLGAGDAVLCSGTLRTGISFRERWPRPRPAASPVSRSGGATTRWRVTRGSATRTSACCWPTTACRWPSSTPRGGGSPARPTSAFRPNTTQERIFGFGERELFAVADAVGARSLNAVDVFGGTWSLDEAAAAFAGLCDRAAEHGLLVHLEFLPWSRIPDLATAWQVVRGADRPNGGLMLDAWHYFRSGPDGTLLRSIPGASILGVQLCDAPAAPEPKPSTPRCTSGCCRARASLTCRTSWATCGRPARTAPSASRCSPTSSMPSTPRRRAGVPARACRGPVGRRLDAQGQAKAT